MKNLLKLAALLGIVGLASWTNRPAFAYTSCDTLHGSFCSSPGTKTPCTTSDGFTSSCTCNTGHAWRCLL
jgi:hypothetical protein